MNRDNQQVTVNKQIDLGWLAGIWDGEGSFSIIQNSKVNKKNQHSLQAKITMENTNVVLIDNVCRILDDNNIKYYLWERDHRSDKHKTTWVVNVIQLLSMKQFCDIVEPYLVSKKSNANILRRFIVSRLSLGLKKQTWDDSEYELMSELQTVNKFGKTETSETMRGKFNEQRETQKRYLDK